MPPTWFEPAIPARDQRQTYASDRTATGIGNFSSEECSWTVISHAIWILDLYDVWMGDYTKYSLLGFILISVSPVSNPGTDFLKDIWVRATYYVICSNFHFVVLPTSTYSRRRLSFYFHLITLRHTPQSVGLLWTGDRPVAETSTWQHKHSQETNIHASGGIRTHDPSKRSASDLLRRPRGHWDRLQQFYIWSILNKI
jgi:hypothetical protein